MSQLNPTRPAEPFKTMTLAGHEYKVRTKYNYMFFLYYQRTLIRNIKDRILETLKPNLEDQDVSSDAVSMESVTTWSQSRPQTDPIYFESFFEVCCTPLDGSPPVKEILLDIEPEKLEELVGFFDSLRIEESVTASAEKKSTKRSPKRGKAAKTS